MNNTTMLFLFNLLSFTIATEAKISIQNIQNSMSNFFHRGKHEKNEQKEFKDVASLELLCDYGNITIHTWKQPSILIETKKNGTAAQHNNTSVTFQQFEDLLQIQTNSPDKKLSTTTHFNIIVSENTKVKIATKHGNIYIKNLLAPVYAQTDRGNIEIIDGTDTSHIQTNHGNIIIQREALKEDTTINAQSDYGNITLQVPQHINSKINALSKQGKIYSDLLITVDPHTIKLTEETYKQQKHTLSGSIAKEKNTKTSGAIDLTTRFGTIKIKPYI